MDFADDIECQFVSTSGDDSDAERVDTNMDKSFKSFNTAALFGQWSPEIYHGIGDRIPKVLSELVQEALEHSILDDFQEAESSTIDDIKINQELKPEQVQQLKAIIHKYRSLWEQADGVVDEPEEEWMDI